MKYKVYMGDKWLTSGESADLSKEIKYEDFENANYYRHLTINTSPEFLAKAKAYEGEKPLVVEVGGAKAELERVTDNGLDIRMLNSEFQKMRKGAVE